MLKQRLDELLKTKDKILLFQYAVHEQKILRTLNYDVRNMSPLNFMGGLPTLKEIPSGSYKVYLTYYLLELYLYSSNRIGKDPFSLIALAIDYIVYRVDREREIEWMNPLPCHSLESVKQLATVMVNLLKHAKSSARNIYIKYSKLEHGRVSIKLNY